MVQKNAKFDGNYKPICARSLIQSTETVNKRTSR